MAAADVSEVLDIRAARLALPRARYEDDEDSSRLPIAQFTLGDALYAVPLSDLCAVLPLKGVTPVPLSPAHVIGVLRWEGRAITAVSLASLLGIRGWRRDPAVLLVVAHGRHLIAVDSEIIPRLSGVPKAAVEAARARREGPATEIVSPSGEILNLLDIGQAVASKGLG